MKQCRACLEKKPNSKFNKNPRNKTDGLTTYCKICIYEISKNKSTVADLRPKGVPVPQFQKGIKRKKKKAVKKKFETLAETLERVGKPIRREKFEAQINPERLEVLLGNDPQRENPPKNPKMYFNTGILIHKNISFMEILNFIGVILVIYGVFK